MSSTRRDFLKSAAGAAALLGLPAGLSRAAPPGQIALRAGYIDQELVEGGPKTNFWAFNGSVPGPLLRFRKGDKIHIAVSNGLNVDTAVHWHGVRVPNAMDGVPFVTQNPIAPGGLFEYEYLLRDSGTFWYHPHQSSFEQVPRGLYGAYVVEEEKPIEVDRELVWVFSDVKVGADGRQVEDYGRISEIGNEGRMGNRVLLNGKTVGAERNVDVRSGERLRLRLINAASARIFRMALAGHAMNVIAYDGQAVEPHAVEALDLGPGMRADVVVDCLQAPGSSFALSDGYRRGAGTLVTLRYTGDKPVRTAASKAPIALAPNAIPEPDLDKAIDHYIMFQGGMRGAPVIGTIDGKPAKTLELMEKYGLAWTMNYSAQHEHALMHEPLFRLDQGEHVILHMINETDFVHPMHLHGHFFRVLAFNGKKNARREWRDTVLLGPRDTVEVAFVADNPGEWMFHCHILDHAAGGMMGTIAVG